jgi:hypothetical protein
MQRPILNFNPRGKLRGEFVPQGWILSPRGEVICWGWNSLFVPPFFQTIPSVHAWEGTFSLGDKVHPWEPSSLLGAKFTPRGQVHPWPPGVKLRMALRFYHWLKKMRAIICIAYLFYNYMYVHMIVKDTDNIVVMQVAYHFIIQYMVRFQPKILSSKVPCLMST